jgi:hypothetical protein
MRALLLATLCLSACAQAPSNPHDAADFDQAMSTLIAGDMPNAIERLQRVAPDSLDRSRRNTRACVLKRFDASTAEVAPETSLPPAAAVALTAYRRYWTAVLTRRAAPVVAENALSEDLARIGGIEGQDLDARSESALNLIEGQGLHALGGITPPLRELMIWRGHATSVESVALPDGPIGVDVTQLGDFVSFGWLGWATCDRYHTGGWTTDRGIMVVTSAWDRGSENYRVSLLAHEAQHFSDNGRYPKLSSADLEYRAKLVELILADRTQRELLEKFKGEAARDRALPHPFASYWLLARLRERLGGLQLAGADVAAIRSAARAELTAHAAALDALGRATATSALPD